MPHGSYKLYLVHRVLVSKSYGSWNAATCRDFFKHYVRLATPLINQPWGGLIDVSQWQLAIPEAESIAVTFERWCCENNRDFVAIVGSSSIIDFQLKRSGMACHNKLVDVRYFCDVDSATAWFIELGLWKKTNDHSQSTC